MSFHLWCNAELLITYEQNCPFWVFSCKIFTLNLNKFLNGSFSASFRLFSNSQQEIKDLPKKTADELIPTTNLVKFYVSGEIFSLRQELI